jgi:hypothetical protein
MSNKNCILIAPLVSHATAGRIAALVKSGYQVSLIDISSRDVYFSTTNYPYSLLHKIYKLNITEVDPFYSRPSLKLLFKDILRSYNVIKENVLLLSKLNEIIYQENPAVVITFYGPLGIHFARLVKKIDAEQKVIFIANLLPSTVLRGGIFLKFIKSKLTNEYVDFKRWIHKIDAIVCSSDEMADFVVRKFNYPQSRLIVVPDFHPNTFQFNENNIQKADFKALSIIFLGAPERWGGRIDNIDHQLNLYSKCVKVYASISIERDDNSSWEPYPYFTDDEVFTGNLSDFAHNFTAALVTYNISRRSERFRSTLPTRFFSALAAGLPIAVKGGIFDAVESFVKKHDIGFVFYTEHDLFEKLSDSKKLKEQKENVIKLLPLFSAESQGEIFKSLFEQLKINNSK